jgi:hypothetical protein
MRVADDGTDITMYYSFNGTLWVQIDTFAKAAGYLAAHGGYSYLVLGGNVDSSAEPNYVNVFYCDLS